VPALRTLYICGKVIGYRERKSKTHPYAVSIKILKCPDNPLIVKEKIEVNLHYSFALPTKRSSVAWNVLIAGEYYYVCPAENR